MVFGHEKQWEFLRKAFVSSRLSHAYLFSGFKGLGKKSMAIEFVKFLNCQSEVLEDRPCNRCSSCLMVDKGIHPDLVLVEPKEGKSGIGIKTIQTVIEQLYLSPFFSFKVAVIDQAHLMTTDAQSCFLKTLEEPSRDSLLILISEHRDFLLKTITSRVQEIKFFPTQSKRIKKILERDGLAGLEVEEIANLSLGKPGLALELSKHLDKLKEERDQRKEFLHILTSDLKTRFEYADILSKKPLAKTLEAWLLYLREILLEKVNNDKETTKIRKLIRGVERTLYLVSTTNVNKRLILESLMLEI
jgi:DNA polymerase-3 subunit delta'